MKTLKKTQSENNKRTNMKQLMKYTKQQKITKTMKKNKQ